MGLRKREEVCFEVREELIARKREREWSGWKRSKREGMDMVSEGESCQKDLRLIGRVLEQVDELLEIK